MPSPRGFRRDNSGDLIESFSPQPLGDRGQGLALGSGESKAALDLGTKHLVLGGQDLIPPEKSWSTVPEMYASIRRKFIEFIPTHKINPLVGKRL